MEKKLEKDGNYEFSSHALRFFFIRYFVFIQALFFFVYVGCRLYFMLSRGQKEDFTAWNIKLVIKRKENAPELDGIKEHRKEETAQRTAMMMIMTNKEKVDQRQIIRNILVEYNFIKWNTVNCDGKATNLLKGLSRSFWTATCERSYMMGNVIAVRWSS